VSRIAVIVPCHNEAVSIARVVGDLRAALPEAAIHVYDNNSTDETAAVARACGAVVRRERQQGKGHVVRRAFADIDADVYLLIDGDDTYDAAAAAGMVRLLLEERLDMVVGARTSDQDGAYRRGHQFGNRLLTGLVRHIFGDRVSDMLSGYRACSRRFVKSFPMLSAGFEIETEMTVHALQLGLPLGEVATAYRARPAGSASKLRTWSDGARILRTIFVLVQQERPLEFFFVIAVLAVAAAVLLGIPVVMEFWRSGLVPRLPTAVLAASLMLGAALSGACGLILESVARGRVEMKRLAYLAIPPPGGGEA
jgi:glycosyltransferase involved in cell wall biosynthesis